MSQEFEATTNNDEMRSEYDFSGGVRGKYYAAYTQSSNVVILDPDVAEIFPDSVSVNEALRSLVKIAKSLQSNTPSFFKRTAKDAKDTKRRIDR